MRVKGSVLNCWSDSLNGGSFQISLTISLRNSESVLPFSPHLRVLTLIPLNDLLQWKWAGGGQDGFAVYKSQKVVMILLLLRQWAKMFKSCTIHCTDLYCTYYHETSWLVHMWYKSHIIELTLFFLINSKINFIIWFDWISDE